jgi:Cell division protein FtsQ/DivIB, C-terminal
VAKRSGRGGARAAAGWNPRAAGLVLCAFFSLGVMTGFSATGRALTLRASAQLDALAARAIDSFAPARAVADRYTETVRHFAARLGLIRAAAPTAPTWAQRANTIAIIERRDGFYALLADGEVRGPVAPGQASDLPVLSGSGLEVSHGSDLVADAAVVVRAEAQLAKMISEMSLGDDGTASLFLDHPRAEIDIDLANSALELRRAAEVLRRFQGREQAIAALDMTTPDQAVVRLRGVDTSVLAKKGALRRIAAAAAARPFQPPQGSP